MKIESLLNTKKRELTEEEAALFMTLCAISNDDKNQIEAATLFGDVFLFRVLSKRLEVFKVPVNKYLIAFVCGVIDSPGKAVMWAYTFNEIYKQQKEQKEIDIETFVYSGFGDELPIEEEYKRIWELQKVKTEFPMTGNALDNPENWL